MSTMSLTTRIEDGLNEKGHVLVLGDCLDVLPHVRDGSIRNFSCSAPYDERRSRTYGGIPAVEYVNWFTPRAHAIAKNMTRDGSFALNLCPGRDDDGFLYTYDHEIISALKGTLGLVERLFWLKGNRDKFMLTNRMMGDSGRKPRHRSCVEPIYVFAKTASHHKDIQALEIPVGKWAESRANGKYGRVDSSTGSGFGCDRAKAAEKKSGRPHNVINEKFFDVDENFFVHPTATKGKAINSTYGHSAAWPTQLAEHLLKYLSQNGDIVCDPFAGSGSTMLAAALSGRRSLGIDICEESIEMAKRRLADHDIEYTFIDARTVA